MKLCVLLLYEAIVRFIIIYGYGPLDSNHSSCHCAGIWTAHGLHLPASTAAVGSRSAHSSSPMP